MAKQVPELENLKSKKIISSVSEKYWDQKIGSKIFLKFFLFEKAIGPFRQVLVSHLFLSIKLDCSSWESERERERERVRERVRRDKNIERNSPATFCCPLIKRSETVLTNLRIFFTLARDSLRSLQLTFSGAPAVAEALMALSVSLTLYLTLSRSQTPIHTHSLSHTHTHTRTGDTHSHTFSLSLYYLCILTALLTFSFLSSSRPKIKLEFALKTLYKWYWPFWSYII